MSLMDNTLGNFAPLAATPIGYDRALAI